MFLKWLVRDTTVFLENDEMKGRFLGQVCLHIEDRAITAENFVRSPTDIAFKLARLVFVGDHVMTMIHLVTKDSVKHFVMRVLARLPVPLRPMIVFLLQLLPQG